MLVPQLTQSLGALYRRLRSVSISSRAST
jgi:hypothetical protein